MPDTPDRPDTSSSAPMTETQAEAAQHTADAEANSGRTVSGGGTTFVTVFLVTALTLVLIAVPFFLFPGLEGSDVVARRVDDSTRTALTLAQDSMAERLHTGGEVRDTSGRVVGRTLPIDSVMARMATGADGSAATALVNR